MPTFYIRCGPRHEPKETWEIFETVTDPVRGQEIVKQNNRRRNRPGWSLQPLEDGWIWSMTKAPPTEDWRVREESRTDYVPFEYQYERDTSFAELTPDLKISFFDSEHSGARNLRKICRLGRYLSHYMGFSPPRVEEICAIYGIDPTKITLKMAETREEIKKVYEEGPDSCMSGEMRQLDTRDHGRVSPVEAYAGPDTAVMYLTNGDDAVVARTVVNKNTKRYVKIYGDHAKLRVLLEKEGYIQDDEALGGCRLLKFQYAARAWICPYLDGVFFKVRVEGEYLVVLREYSSFTSNESGYLT